MTILRRFPALLQRAIEHVLGDAITEVRSVSGGSISQAAHLWTDQGEYFVKWNSDTTSDQFQTEAEGLKALAHALNHGPHPLQIPQPLYVSSAENQDSSDIPDFLLMDWIKTGRVGKDFDEQLGLGLASLHRHTAAQFGFASHTYCGSTRQENHWRDQWEIFYTEQRIAPLIRRAANEQGLAGSQLRMFEVLLTRLPQWITTEIAR